MYQTYREYTDTRYFRVVTHYKFSIIFLKQNKIFMANNRPLQVFSIILSNDN